MGNFALSAGVCVCVCVRGWVTGIHADRSSECVCVFSLYVCLSECVCVLVDRGHDR